MAAPFNTFHGVFLSILHMASVYEMLSERALRVVMANPYDVEAVVEMVRVNKEFIHFQALAIGIASR